MAPAPLLRGALVALAAFVAFGSTGAYLHALGDGEPSLGASLRLVSAVRLDPWSVAWVPALAGALLVAGLLVRPALAWSAIGGLGVFGVFFFLYTGWLYVVVVPIFAAGLAHAEAAAKERARS